MKYYNQFINEAKSKEPELIDAALKGQSNKVVKLIKNGTELNVVDKNGITALMTAVNMKYLIIVKILLEAGANPNIQDISGFTALMYVKTLKIFGLLIEHGADVNVVNKEGRNPMMKHLDFSDDFNKTNILAIFKKYLEHGLNLDTKDNGGENLYDIVKHKLEAVEVLVSSNSTFNGLTSYGKMSYEHKGVFLKTIEKYMDENFPQYKEEWEMKQDINKFNL